MTTMLSLLVLLAALINIFVYDFIPGDSNRNMEWNFELKNKFRCGTFFFGSV